MRNDIRTEEKGLAVYYNDKKAAFIVAFLLYA